ncbi:hypothetical protein [Litorihabitans aurantiacus]|uniref:hypothetical protein n=1 Tax=Litorihabitans aurantiacus TaxID=1930061 RepID=UPI0024E098E1|nr:hypothetical protein [Litorihabitans aurantiacus]
MGEESALDLPARDLPGRTDVADRVLERLARGRHAARATPRPGGCWVTACPSST